MTFGAACPSPQIDASLRTCDSDSSADKSQALSFINLAAWWVPSRHGEHWPQLSSTKNSMAFVAASRALSCWLSTTTAADPIKQPCSCRVSKSSGISANREGNIPPDAPPGRYPYKSCPSSIPPQNSSTNSIREIPAGAILTPGFLTLPLTLKLLRPFRPRLPKLVNHDAPRSKVSRTQYRVSKL